jgi:hypothetical protein
MLRQKILNVRAFIDWDSARRILKYEVRQGRNSLCLRSMMEVQTYISELLFEHDKTANYRVHCRVYHGWHRGKTKTEDYKEFEKVSNGKELSRRLGNCAFAPEIEFGNVLLCGGKRSQLFDTLRRRSDADEDEQKMVDTALVSDLLMSAKNERDAIHIVIGDDDDLIPGVITAERLGATVFLARVKREHDNYFVNVNDLIFRRKQNV